MQKIIESPKRMFIIILLAGILGIIAGECYGQTPNYVKLKSIEPAPGSGYAIGTGTSGSPVYTKSLSVTTLSATTGYFLGSVNTQTNNASHTSALTGSIGSLSSSTITAGLLGSGVSPTFPLHVVNTVTPQARFAYDATNMFDINVPSNGNAILALKPSAQFVFSNSINLTGLNITTGTSAGLGLAIATSTNSRLGFYGATPATQRSATSDLGTALSDLGLRAAGTSYPITTSGAITSTGAFSTSNFKSGYVAKTSTYTITTSDYTIDCTSGTFTVTLPTAVGNAGRMYVVRNGGTGVITIACNGAQTINGVTTKVLNTQYSGFVIMSDGANNIVIGSF